MELSKDQEKLAANAIEELFTTICRKTSTTELNKLKDSIRKKNLWTSLGINDEELDQAKTMQKFLNLLARNSHLAHNPVLLNLSMCMQELSREDLISPIEVADEILKDIHALFIHVPEEIRGQQERAAYRKALKEGNKEVHRTRLMIVGQERVGKTSLKRSLTHQSFNAEESSTEGISASSFCKIDIKHATSWQLHEEGDDSTSFRREYEESLKNEAKYNYQNFIMENVPVCISCANVTCTSQMQNMPPGPRVTPVYAVHQASLPAAASSFPPQKSITQVDIETRRSPSNEPTHQLEVGKRQISGAGEPIVLSLWDFAGQNLYYTLHKTFLSSRAIYVVVFNLCQDLDKPIQTNGRPDDQGDSCHSNRMTPMQYLDFWMHSIFTYTKENPSKERSEQKSPPIFIVGTHRNSVGGDDLPDSERKQLIERIFTRIRIEISSKPYARFVVQEFYAIENTLETNNTKICELRKHIENIAGKEPYMGQLIPLRWLQFDDRKLKEVAKSGGIPVLTLQQVKDDFGLEDETELLTMLKFYHDLGHIVYFGGDGDQKSQALKDVVILDPQWLIDALKKVITITPPRKQMADHVQSWNNLKDSGILENKLIDYMWRDILSHKKALLDLMDKFDLLCERTDQPQEEACSSPAASTVSSIKFQRQHSHASPEDMVSYYVPSMLRRQTSHSSQPESAKQKNASVFCVDFHGFLPDGLFHRLVVRALRWSQTLGGTHPSLKYDQASFFVNDQHEFVLQLVRKKDLAYLKVTVKRAQFVQTRRKRRPKEEKIHVKKSPSSDVTCKVHRFVEENLQNLKDMWIKRIDYCISVLCLNNKHKMPHLLPLDECLKKPQVVCRLGSSQMVFDTYKFQAMFKQESSEEEPSALEKRQPMSDVHFREIAKKLGPEWEELATYLNFSKEDIYRFRSESSNIDGQIFSMLVKRRQNRGGKVEKMRKEIVDALRKMGKNELADEVQNY
ncbi:probable serine/threonine-protein kinase roco8 [Acanthaster planci]|uniref:non-specific serine/threonine protein kinase n=1 Tax=Acanthaster planci TaxID=133434 RepID=A0A8B8A2N5_ACAPL|nr:probable serine/threonine-protein kinase roco8 [Acanthaster planci]